MAFCFSTTRWHGDSPLQYSGKYGLLFAPPYPRLSNELTPFTLLGCINSACAVRYVCPWWRHYDKTIVGQIHTHCACAHGPRRSDTTRSPILARNLYCSLCMRAFFLNRILKEYISKDFYTMGSFPSFLIYDYWSTPIHTEVELTWEH